MTKAKAPAAPAGFLVRTVAWLIDWLFLLGIDAIVGSLLDLAGARPLAGSSAAAILPVCTGFAYFGYFFSTSGQTPGKRLLNLRVVRQDGQPLTWRTGTLRYIGYLLSGWAFFLGYLLVALDPQRRGLHDLLAKTSVVQE